MNRRGLFAFFALTPVMAVEAIAKPPEPPKPKIEGAPFDGQTILTLTAQDKPKPLENKAIINGQPFTIMKQKLDWGKKYFPDIPMIVCLAKDKNTYGHPGDILIDDTPKYEHLWTQMGGIWITHTSAHNTIAKLKKLKVI